MADLRRQDVVRRIWARDPTVWTGADEDRWLGWLTLPTQERADIARLSRFAGEIKAEGVQDVVLLGMGGSSLAPEVIQAFVGAKSGYPNLHVLDSTDPGRILTIERSVDFRRTLFLVASKSGSTLEVNILKQYFFDRATEQLGGREAGQRFVLTTDPGSKLHVIAKQEHFRAIFDGVPSVGGRYSALSNFGLVPAALIGADVTAFLARAETMARRCGSDGPDNTAFELGVVLGELALHGRDKPTLIVPAGLAAFGAWLEQLVAESLGKQGKGILPIDGEVPGAPGRIRTRSRVRPASARGRARPRGGRRARSARARRSSGHPHRLARSGCARRRVLSLGVCDGRRRRRSRRQPVRSARRGIDESRHATYCRRLRADRRAAVGRALRIPGRWALYWISCGKATTSRCSRSSK